MRQRLMAPMVSLVAVVSLFALTAQQVRADPRDFTLINESEVVITHVYVSASDTTNWEEDVLGRDVLVPGDSVDIVFSPLDWDAGKCVYDIKVLGRGGQEGYLYKIDLCSTSTVRFS